ncbi:MAG: putative capsular polysaccharide synthesis family protein [Bacteroidia bacterium]
MKNFPSRVLNKVKGKWLGLKNKVRKMLAEKQIFLVYSMGKVGTTSVFSYIKRNHPDIPLHHVHFLSDNWVKKKLPSLDAEFHGNITVANEVYASLEKHKDRRVKIVTMVREPMVREISDIFQNWKGLLNVNSINDVSVKELSKYLDNHDHEYVLNWFDTEFREYLDFDIYAHPFDKQKGYSIYKTKRADILCVSTEKLSSCIEEAMKKFAGMNINASRSSNTSENKEGKELYRELVQHYKAPKEKLDLLYNSKYVRHFYDDNEIAGFIKKWSRQENDNQQKNNL